MKSIHRQILTTGMILLLGKNAVAQLNATINLSDLDGNNGFIMNGVSEDDESGFSVSSAGDVNDDGIDDLIIGANLADPNGNLSAGSSY